MGLFDKMKQAFSTAGENQTVNFTFQASNLFFIGCTLKRNISIKRSCTG